MTILLPASVRYFNYETVYLIKGVAEASKVDIDWVEQLEDVEHAVVLLDEEDQVVQHEEDEMKSLVHGDHHGSLLGVQGPHPGLQELHQTLRAEDSQLLHRDGMTQGVLELFLDVPERDTLGSGGLNDPRQLLPDDREHLVLAQLDDPIFSILPFLTKSVSAGVVPDHSTVMSLEVDIRASVSKNLQTSFRLILQKKH